MGQDNMTETVMFDFSQQVPGILVGEVSAAALDTLFQRPWVWAFDQHGGIVIGFQHQERARLEMLFHHTGGNP